MNQFHAKRMKSWRLREKRVLQVWHDLKFMTALRSCCCCLLLLFTIRKYLKNCSVLLYCSNISQFNLLLLELMNIYTQWKNFKNFFPDFDTDCTFSAWRSNAEFRWQGLSWPKSLMVLENGEREDEVDFDARFMMRCDKRR